MGMDHFFQGFRQDRMAGVGYGPDGDFPGRLPRQAFFIHEDTHQFRNDQCRMGIVDVDGYVLGEAIDCFSPYFCL